MIGWIDKQTGETAQQLLTRLTALGDYVSTSRHGGSSIAYSANGLILRQREQENIKEIRGITEAAATLLEDLKTDNTQSQSYYKAIGDNGEYAVVGLTIGTKVEVNSGRANEGGAWTATITEKTYTAEDASGWTTTRPSTATTTGIVSDYSQGTKRISTKAFGTSKAYSEICVLYENFIRKTRTFMFLTQTEAEAKVTALNSTVAGEPVAARISWVDGLSSQTAFGHVKNYTTKVAAARYVSAERGWEVQCEEVEYSPAAKYWRGESVESSNYKYWQYEASGELQNITAEPLARVQIAVADVGGTTSWRILED